jgi:hypothetical protein
MNNIFKKPKITRNYFKRRLRYLIIIGIKPKQLIVIIRESEISGF